MPSTAVQLAQAGPTPPSQGVNNGTSSMSTASSRAAARAHIAEIDAKILTLRQRLRHSIQVLEAEKSRTQEQLNSYTYPVLTLPNEIMSEIFVHFLPSYPSPPPLAGLRSPTALTHICRRWRAIAITTPALWRAISWPRHCDDERQLLQWLRRSQSLPLSFLMETIKDTLTDECLAALILHRERWEYVTFAVASECDVFKMQGAMPLLRQLEIECWSDASPPPSAIRLHEVPRLRSVALWEISSSIDILPWSQLTSLTLIYHSNECFAILQHTVNLVHCHLVPYGDLEVATASGIRLPSLESLVLTQLTGEDAPTDFFDTIIAPALRTLEVSEAFLQPDPPDMLLLFLSTSGCRLQELCITGDTRSISEAVYRRTFGNIMKLSFDMSLTDYTSYAEKLAQRRYVVLEPSVPSNLSSRLA
ncbi:hypothetical protein B0H12DRAFT_210543 [Mycena haematopus]|nr:hypothetical protein B0H12DRAFT_210543 [Mycena haematopus]